MKIYNEEGATTRYYFNCILENKYPKTLCIDCKGGIKKAEKILKGNYNKVTEYKLDISFRI